MDRAVLCVPRYGADETGYKPVHPDQRAVDAAHYTGCKVDPYGPYNPQSLDKPLPGHPSPGMTAFNNHPLIGGVAQDPETGGNLRIRVGRFDLAPDAVKIECQRRNPVQGRLHGVGGVHSAWLVGRAAV